ncbi:hypothetical protein UFOVP640_35 [uncultured Caudovirales phage]|uniref:Uncharacterized protein n=1 Tax=uncultured Caudovirales phage TaxID=2100421 RepID=A0A6J5N8U4_9CAUD|nr:hypothetical protein UFOVP640_35 [uncultured Caudovirales phage]CAB5226106.1 hypothetical protein UFOVP759_39 [uncultured Caudovirales phage]
MSEILDQIAGPDLPCEAPEQQEKVKWEYKPRKNPKWGEVTRRGLVVGRGPNQKVVDPDEVYRLSGIGCTMEEMAHFFGIDRETLKYNFLPYIQRANSELYMRLRTKQIEVALDGNPTMLIWLGKNMLGQSDNPTNVDSNKVLPWTDGEDKKDES